MWLANAKVEATKDKDSDNFVNDAVEARKHAYFFGFDDCKKMVTK